jgi:DNA-binding transcriptional LysR family regulator
MLNLDCVSAFIAIADTGSFTDAARRLALSKSVVSERMKDLEQSLGAKLVHRTTRCVVLTADGATFYERAKRLVREAELAASELADRRGSVAGLLRISAPVSFGCLHLGPALFGFIARYPEVELTLDLEDRFIDVLDEGYDVIVRHGPVNGERVIVKPVGTSARLLVASPSYLKRRGKPVSLEDLKQHKGIMYSHRGGADWRFRTARSRFTAVHPHVVVRVNNGLMMREAALRGLGIALLPTFFLEASRRERTLSIINVGAEAEGATLYIGYPEHLRTSAKIRAHGMASGRLRKAAVLGTRALTRMIIDAIAARSSVTLSAMEMRHRWHHRRGLCDCPLSMICRPLSSGADFGLGSVSDRRRQEQTLAPFNHKGAKS